MPVAATHGTLPGSHDSIVRHMRGCTRSTGPFVPITFPRPAQQRVCCMTHVTARPATVGSFRKLIKIYLRGCLPIDHVSRLQKCMQATQAMGSSHTRTSACSHPIGGCVRTSLWQHQRAWSTVHPLQALRLWSTLSQNSQRCPSSLRREAATLQSGW